MDDIDQPTAERSRAARTAAVLLATLLAITAGFVAASPAPSGAAEPPPAGLTWKVSEHAFTSSSLAPGHATTDPATKIADVGFSFPTATDVAVNPLTGAATATFPGTITFGNTNQGNYRIVLGDPTLAIAAGRATGTITADVSYALFDNQTQTHVWTGPTRVVVANLTFAADAIVDTGANISFTATPEFVLRTDLAPEDNPNGYRQFPQTLLDALSPQLISHFRQTNTNQGTKAPTPVSVSFDYTPSAPPAGLTWRVSQHAFTSSSLAPAHATSGQAVKTDDGFGFPLPSSAHYDPRTGQGQIDFPGGFDLGNTNQGNYRIRLTDPSIVLAGDGTGDLVADVSYALFDNQAQTHVWTGPSRVVVADLTIPGDAVTLTGDQLSFVVTPDFVLRSDLAPEDNPNGYRQFPQTLLDALSPQLISHFRQTNTNQGTKAPAPVGVNVTVTLPDPDEEMIRAIYHVTFRRAAGPGEIAYWTGRLDAGMSPRKVATAIATSAEGRRLLVVVGYGSTFDRTPGAGEVAYWVGRLNGGMTAEQLVVELLGSPEAWALADGTPAGLARLLYETVLGRPGDAGGLAYWTNRLAAATSANGRRSVIRAFYVSGELTRIAVRGAIDPPCGDGTAEPAVLDTLTTTWTQGGRNPVVLAAVATALVCPELPAPI
ncbi:MAG TPA: DUF4214 domain-containing protein [Iamia sp.]|nr:DUF4214 domain-containing protein [Iamia sp.]